VRNSDNNNSSNNHNRNGCAVAHSVNRWRSTAEAPVWLPACSCEIYGEQSGVGTALSLSILAYPVSIILPNVHTNISFIYRRHYTILATDNCVKWNTSIFLSNCCNSKLSCTIHALRIFLWGRGGGGWAYPEAIYNLCLNLVTMLRKSCSNLRAYI
jgi:hypothetical protein